MDWIFFFAERERTLTMTEKFKQTILPFSVLSLFNGIATTHECRCAHWKRELVSYTFFFCGKKLSCLYTGSQLRAMVKCIELENVSLFTQIILVQPTIFFFFHVKLFLSIEFLRSSLFSLCIGVSVRTLYGNRTHMSSREDNLELPSPPCCVVWDSNLMLNFRFGQFQTRIRSGRERAE